MEACLNREDMASEAADEDGEIISLSSNTEIDPNNPNGWENRRRRVSNPGIGGAGGQQTYLTV